MVLQRKFKMKFQILFLVLNVSNAIDNNLTAVHYSIVIPGIDEVIKAGKL